MDWYPSRGHFFTVTSSKTMDQSYVHGRNVYENISIIVDQIFDRYIRKGSSLQPFFAQYSDGVVLKREGWLSLWGSKDLAEKGERAFQIIQHYYGQDMSIEAAELESGLPASFPGFDIKRGMCGHEIREAQLMLNIISTTFQAIPKIGIPNGHFDKDMVEAIEAFQKIFHLPVTGVIGYATWNIMSRVYDGIMNSVKARFVDMHG
jgi:peptidoglycan hydrolase-like protein with peptidoglycan-binding domain